MEKDFYFKKKFINEKRKLGIILLLIGLGLPLVLYFFQDAGQLGFHRSSIIAERSLTQREATEIKRAIEQEKKRMGRIERAIEEVRERYRRLADQDLHKDRWVIKYNVGFSIPFKYIVALGIILALLGVGKFIVG